MMMQNRRVDVKEAVIPLNTKNRQPNRLFSHKKTTSRSLLQKKPQILLMKWNDFLEQYHCYKQLTSINNSLNSANLHLKKKKQQLSIQDVPYILSEQISVDEKYIEQRQNGTLSQQIKSIVYEQVQVQDIIHLNQSSVIDKISGSKPALNHTSYRSISLKSKADDKIVVSIKLSEQIQSKTSLKEDNQDYQNFTDNQQNSEQDQKSQLESTNKNSKIQLSSITQAPKTKINEQNSSSIEQSLFRTAYFSFNTNENSKKIKNQDQTQYKNSGQQNVNNLNSKQNKSRKFQVLHKLQNEQYTNRQSNRKVFEQDKQYLYKFISKK